MASAIRKECIVGQKQVIILGLGLVHLKNEPQILLLDISNECCMTSCQFGPPQNAEVILFLVDVVIVVVESLMREIEHPNRRTGCVNECK